MSPDTSQDNEPVPLGPQGVPAPNYRVLDDQPHDLGKSDPLSFSRIADDLAKLVLKSRESTPLALGIEGGWGSGKSTLMQALAGSLDKWANSESTVVKIVNFNAWTAREDSALEGLVKSVLNQLDSSVLRKAARNQNLISVARAIAMVAAGWLGIGNVINQLWDDISIDPQTRNQIQNLIEQGIASWTSANDETDSRHLLVVFVDDLDRCPPSNVMQVFEAIKLYLDVRGIVFIVGYDREVIFDTIVRVKEYKELDLSQFYLEKIVQLVYHLPVVGDESAKELVQLFLESSRTSDLFDSPARKLIIEQNSRNPRRIKRFLNEFVLEYGLDDEWQQFGAETVIRWLIVRTYFPEFAKLFAGPSPRDPVDDFTKYVSVRDLLRRSGIRESDDWHEVQSVLDRWQITAASDTSPSELLVLLDREVTPTFNELAKNAEFLSLLVGLGDFTEREALRNKVRRSSASTRSVEIPLEFPEGMEPSRGFSYGLRKIRDGTDDDPNRGPVLNETVQFEYDRARNVLVAPITYSAATGLQFKCFVDVPESEPPIDPADSRLTSTSWTEPSLDGTRAGRRIWFLLREYTTYTSKSGDLNNLLEPST